MVQGAVLAFGILHVDESRVRVGQEIAYALNDVNLVFSGGTDQVLVVERHARRKDLVDEQRAGFELSVAGDRFNKYLEPWVALRVDLSGVLGRQLEHLAHRFCRNKMIREKPVEQD